MVLEPVAFLRRLIGIIPGAGIWCNVAAVGPHRGLARPTAAEHCHQRDRDAIHDSSIGYATLRYANGDRHLVLSMQDDESGARVLAIDLVSATVVVLASEATSSFTGSPDGRFVMVWSTTLMIVPIEGGTPRTTTIDGNPQAWLR